MFNLKSYVTRSVSQHNRSLLTISLSLMFVLTIAAANSFAATFVVNTTTDTQDATAGNGVCADSGGLCSIRAAITEANALAGADVITLPAGTYTITIAEASENANANGDFDLTSEITINGGGSGSTIVQAAASRGVAIGRVFHLRATGVPTNISDLTVRYGRYTTAASTFGAGIRVDVGAVNATLTNVIVTENDNGTSGGGIAVSSAAGATLTLNNCTVSNNTAGGILAGGSTGAGIQGNSVATINLNNSTITGNSVSNTSTTVAPTAGGISSIGTTNITNSIISNNSASSSGTNAFTGGVHVTGGTTTITGSTISGNSANVTAGGGAALIGGVYNQQATVSITNSTVSGNSTTNTVTPASAFHAGIRALSQTVLATTTITNSTISNNTTNGEGGGVVNISAGAANAIINISSTTISGNSVLSATGLGAGLEQFSTSTGLATINATNSTISGNSAATGAGVYNSGATSTINLNYSTVAANTAATIGGGLFQTAGTINLKNSIVADNTAPTGPDISGTITSQDYNHVENTSGGTFFSGGADGGKSGSITFFALANDVTGTDPQLGPLANNFGSTLTHLPSGTSPVLNSIPNGTSECGTTIINSQNAVTRPFGPGCEKGAAERSSPTAAAASVSGRVTTADGRGIVNAVLVVSGNSLQHPITVRTSSFGYYMIDDLEAGETYVITINSKRFTFTTPSRVVTLNDNIGDFDFVAEP